MFPHYFKPKSKLQANIFNLLTSSNPVHSKILVFVTALSATSKPAAGGQWLHWKMHQYGNIQIQEYLRKARSL